MFPAENTVQKIYPARQRIGSNHLKFSTILSFAQFSVSKMGVFQQAVIWYKIQCNLFYFFFLFYLFFLFFDSYQITIPLLRSYFIGGLLERTSCKNTLLGSFKYLFQTYVARRNDCRRRCVVRRRNICCYCLCSGTSRRESLYL